MEAALAKLERLPSVQSADMASVYVEKVAGLVDTLAKRDDNNGALEALREAIEKVTITPTPMPKPVEVKVRGSLPGPSRPGSAFAEYPGSPRCSR